MVKASMPAAGTVCSRPRCSAASIGTSRGSSQGCERTGRGDTRPAGTSAVGVLVSFGARAAWFSSYRCCKAGKALPANSNAIEEPSYRSLGKMYLKTMNNEKKWGRGGEEEGWKHRC